MNAKNSNCDEGEKLSAFDLDALREGFRKYVEEHNITAADWGEQAKQFLERQRDGARTLT